MSTNSTTELAEAEVGFVSGLRDDFVASIVVFLVALPLCLGIALASGAPLASGLVAGVIGGIVVGFLSGSHTSVSGPAAGLAAVVAAQIVSLGSFEAFLLAVVVAGIIQVGLGVAKAGAMSSFFPSSVIRGLLAAIGVLLILKQIPHLLGHDTDPEGEFAFIQPDHQNTFSEIITLFEGEIYWGAAVIGLASIVLLLVWDRIKSLKKTGVPSALVVVMLGIALQQLFGRLGEGWLIEGSHLVSIPVAGSFSELSSYLHFPDFTQLANPAIYVAAMTLAIVASLETLLNLEATDKLDSKHRNSPPSRELLAQGVGNVIAGLIGGIPVTSVIVRSSVNIGVGARSKKSAILHGVLLLVCIASIPTYLNMIPLSSLAAILIVTGYKLASPKLFRQMYSEGRQQFLPFMGTLIAIVFTDLLMGILLGLATSVLFILNSNLRKPIRRVVEKHFDGDIVHVELANQVSFLNRAALNELFQNTKRGTNVLIDASDSDYIDSDILSLIKDFKDNVGPARGVSVSLRGFKDKYQIRDDIRYADYSTRDLRDRITPQQIQEILRDGNRRFTEGKRVSRDFNRQVDATAVGQNPLAVVLSCIDSRVPAEIVFDLGIGDIFSVRVAGNIIGSKSLGSMEFAVAVTGVKFVLVLGHTRCGAVTSSIQLFEEGQNVEEATGCTHLESIVQELQKSITDNEHLGISTLSQTEREAKIDAVAKRNVKRTVKEIVARSPAIASKVRSGDVKVLGAIYDVKTGAVDFFDETN